MAAEVFVFGGFSLLWKNEELQYYTQFSQLEHRILYHDTMITDMKISGLRWLCDGKMDLFINVDLKCVVCFWWVVGAGDPVFVTNIELVCMQGIGSEQGS